LVITDKQDLVHALQRCGNAFSQVIADEDLLEFVLPTVQADFDIVESYSFADCAGLDIPILAFYGTEDQTVDGQKVGDWREETRGSFHVCGFAGGHFFFIERKEQLVSAMLDSCNGAPIERPYECASGFVRAAIAECAQEHGRSPSTGVVRQSQGGPEEARRSEERCADCFACSGFAVRLG
jgi:hypothetical protein